MDAARVFRSMPGRVLTVVTAVAGLACLVAMAAGGSTELLRYGAVPLLVVLVVWAAFWRPQVEVSDGGIELRNVLRTVHVPWPAYRGADTRLALTIETTAGDYTAWATPTRSGPAARRDLARGAEARRATGATADAAALEIAARHAALREAGHLDHVPAQGAPAPTVRWHWRLVAGCVTLSALAALGALAG